MRCIMLKQFSISVKSMIVNAVKSRWRLKSPRRSTDGEVEENSARNAEKSDRNEGLGLVG